MKEERKMRLYDLKTEYRKNPSAIDTASPRFSWKIESDARGVVQTAYEITVYRMSDQEPVWESGEVNSGKSQQITYQGRKLESLTKYAWRVKVTTKDESGQEETAESQPAEFMTALYDKNPWKAKWILPAEKTDPDHMMPAWYLRKTFMVKPGLKAAYALQTAHGLYEFYLNGKIGTEEMFKPGFTVYYKRLQYQTYDVTALLAEGENIWAVELADGWWRGTTGGDIRNNFGIKTAFFGQIVLEYEDGTREFVISDASFLCANGGLLEADMKLGEVFDARREPQGWKEAGFDDSTWQQVIEADQAENHNTEETGDRECAAECEEESYGTDQLVASSVVPVLERETFVGRVLTDAAGSTVIDFGQNIAGNVHMIFRDTEPGQHITLEFAEDFKDGTFNNENVGRGTPVQGLERFQQIDYIAKGSAKEVYNPKFSVFGFRYLRITGYGQDAGGLDPKDFTAVAMYSDCPDVGDFTCSDDRVNRLISNSRWSQKGNFLDVPTDCPTRERSPWTGDSQIYAKTAGWFAEVYPFYEKWMKDVAADQCENGKVLNIAPNCMMPHDAQQIKKGKEQMEMLARQAAENPQMVQDPAMMMMSMIYADDGAYIMDGSSGWGDTATITPWVMYLRYGDKQILENQYDSTKAWVDYERNLAKEPNPLRKDAPWYAPEAGDDGCYIWDSHYQWGEWLEPDIPNAVMAGADAILKPDPEVPTAFMCYSARLVSQMAEVLGKEEDAAEYREFSNRVKAAYNKYLIGENGVIKEGRQAPHVRALAFDLCRDEETKQAVAAYLNRLVVEKDYTLNTGFLSTAELLNVLADNGYTDTAYRLLLQEKCPGWLFNVLEGATTIPETWDAMATHKDSMNHYSYGAVCDFLFCKCCGINWDEKQPGFGHFVIRPMPGNEFSYAGATYESIYGEVKSSWETGPEKNRKYTFVIPANTSASVYLPDGRTFELGSGTYEF